MEVPSDPNQLRAENKVDFFGTAVALVASFYIAISVFNGSISKL
jgi:hypothetical protein